MKKCVLAIVLLLICCMFFGCGQKLPSSNEFILLSLVTNNEGQVVQSLDFSVGSKKLEASGATALDIANFKKALLKNIKTFHNEFLLNFAIIYSSNPNPKFKIGSGVLLSSTTYNEQSDSIGFNIVFPTNETWNYYHPSTGEGNNSQIEGTFVLKNVNSGTFPFASQVSLASGEKTTVGERYTKAYTEALSEANINIEYSPDFVYNYATTSPYLKSDSEYQYSDGELKHHVWLRNAREYKEEQNISLYVMDLNMGYFYLLILIVPLIGLGVSVILIKVIEKRKHR